jgi:hypothetical protein
MEDSDWLKIRIGHYKAINLLMGYFTVFVRDRSHSFTDLETEVFRGKGLHLEYVLLPFLPTTDIVLPDR